MCAPAGSRQPGTIIFYTHLLNPLLISFKLAMSCPLRSLTALDARCAAFDHGTRGRCLLPLSAFGAQSEERFKAGDCVAWCAGGANTAQVRAQIPTAATWHLLFPISN
jgi:hypothetical protein